MIMIGEQLDPSKMTHRNSAATCAAAPRYIHHIATPASVSAQLHLLRS
jgi:hypothetical protein